MESSVRVGLNGCKGDVQLLRLPTGLRGGIAELVRLQHVDDLSDVGLRSLAELIKTAGVELESLPNNTRASAKKWRGSCTGTHLNAMDIILDFTSVTIGLSSARISPAQEGRTSYTLLERHLEARSDERLHLGVAPVVADGDDGDFRLLDEGVEGANTSAVSGRHSIDLVHDDDRLLAAREVGVRLVGLQAGRQYPATTTREEGRTPASDL